MAKKRPDLFCETVQVEHSLCVLCAAAYQGLACWEVDSSPCCHRSRLTCERCPVFIGYMRSMAQPAKVLIATTSGALIEGTIFVTAGSRVSDVLNHPARAFIAVSRPQWRSDGPLADARPPVVILSLSAIAWVAPLVEEKAEATGARAA
jgi:hypothetical protein